MRRTIIAAALGVALLLPAAASARRLTPIEIALAKATQLWHAQPCGGHYRVRLVSSIDNNPAIPAQADFDTPTGRGFYTSPPSTWTSCEVLLRASNWTRANIEANWSQLCTEVLHEDGHLTGHVHTDPTAQEVAEGATYGWVYGNAPGVAPDTPEQAAVMRSGNNSYTSDVRRCGMEPRQPRTQTKRGTLRRLASASGGPRRPDESSPTIGRQSCRGHSTATTRISRRSSRS